MSDYTNRPSTDYTNRQTYVRETQKSSGGGMAFLVGGLVVAVGIIAYAMYDGEIAGTQVVPVERNSTTVTIEPSTPAEPMAPVDPVAPAGTVDPVAPTVEEPADPANAAPFPADPVPQVDSGAAAGN